MSRATPAPTLTSEEERETARAAAKSLALLLESRSMTGASAVELTFRAGAGAGSAPLRLADASVRLPVVALRLLREALELAGQGHGVRLIAQDAQMTTGEAAEALGVSRPHLVRLLERGEIPFRKVGAHRRVRYDDVLAYRARTGVARKSGSEELDRPGQDRHGCETPSSHRSRHRSTPG